MEKLWILKLETKTQSKKKFICEKKVEKEYFGKHVTEYEVYNAIKLKQLESDIRTYSNCRSPWIIIGKVETNTYIIPSEVRISFKEIDKEVNDYEERDKLLTWTIDFKVSEDKKLLVPYRIIDYSLNYKCDAVNDKYVDDQIVSEIERYRENDYYMYEMVYHIDDYYIDIEDTDEVNNMCKGKYYIYEHEGEDAKKRLEEHVNIMYNFKVEEYKP